MRMCALLQKVSRLDGTCITAGQVYRMGTRSAGEILRLPVGSLETGQYADFAALDLHDLSLAPKRELFANMVYAMQPGAIRTVVVGGKVVFEQGKIKAVSEAAIGGRVDRLFEQWAKLE
jgi:5-methylthioadenosine/S-adenosylhomocysteine deaminase